MLDLYYKTISEFSQLWCCCQKDDKLEIICPYATVNDDFVSIFIEKKEDVYIVSDGGEIQAGEYYDIDLVETDRVFKKILNNYKKSFGISECSTTGSFIKEVNNAEQIPSAVLDMAMFITGIVGAADSLRKEEKE